MGYDCRDVVGIGFLFRRWLRNTRMIGVVVCGMTLWGVSGKYVTLNAVNTVLRMCTRVLQCSTFGLGLFLLLLLLGRWFSHAYFYFIIIWSSLRIATNRINAYRFSWRCGFSWKCRIGYRIRCVTSAHRSTSEYRFNWRSRRCRRRWRSRRGCRVVRLRLVQMHRMRGGSVWRLLRWCVRGRGVVSREIFQRRITTQFGEFIFTLRPIFAFHIFIAVVV